LLLGYVYDRIDLKELTVEAFEQVRVPSSRKP
jgi:hypothetical protein